MGRGKKTHPLLIDYPLSATRLAKLAAETAVAESQPIERRRRGPSAIRVDADASSRRLARRRWVAPEPAAVASVPE
jgi:hypothetical protein